jgi:endonuclease YncB( thermonuclease family)
VRSGVSRLLLRAALCTFLLLHDAHADTIAGRVVGVADGDTVTVLDTSMTQHKIRLAGIDAPEKSQPFGQKSKQSLSDLVYDRWVTVETDKKDRYGREVGKVIKDGMDANLEQIKRGLAWHYKAYEREQSAADRLMYAEAEERARGARIGLWGEVRQVPPWEFRKAQREQREPVNQ